MKLSYQMSHLEGEFHQVSPFVMIDYLQIIDPPKTLRTASDKQIADYNIKRLKALADYQNPRKTPSKENNAVYVILRFLGGDISGYIITSSCVRDLSDLAYI